MNQEQKKLFEENIDLAEVLAINATCVEAEYETLESEAMRTLAEVATKYDKAKHGDFEQYATLHIKRVLTKVINSNHIIVASKKIDY